MVWFQCEDCGENLKKPKLPNHFRSCSAYKFSCIDCGVMFDQQSVQGHTQCISEAEKYGPKDQQKATHNGQTKPNKKEEKPPDFDIYVGLSARPPWACSLCNTNTTSKQTLMLHAEGKKHKAKARAFHAAQNQSNETKERMPNEKEVAIEAPVTQANGSMEADEVSNVNGSLKSHPYPNLGGKKDVSTKKTKVDATSNGLITGDDKSNKKKRKISENSDKDKNLSQSYATVPCLEQKGQSKKKRHTGQNESAYGERTSIEASESKIKWKKLAISVLKENPDGAMKIKKLHKQIVKAMREAGATEDKALLLEMLTNKIMSSSRFSIDGKYVQLVAKVEDS